MIPSSRATRHTIRDVAVRAGVSLATVSRVLNGSAVVSDATAQGVRAAAAALDFRPNRLGRNLRASRTHSIGVMLPTLRHPVFAECLGSIECAARDAGHAVTFATTDYDPSREEQASELLLQQRVDGLILTVANAAHSHLLDKLDREGIPYVLVYNQLPPVKSAKAPRPCVSVDNRKAAHDMVAHLIALGHQQIRMLTGQFGQSDRARLRYKGYGDAMRKTQLPVPDAVEFAFMVQDTRSVLMDVMHVHPRPTALFCASDQLAMQVIRDLQAMGLRVPQDVSVAGFDGVQVGELMSPALTTLVQPSAEVGLCAFDLLQRLISGEQPCGSALLHHTLRLGGTVAPYSLAKPSLSALPLGPALSRHSAAPNKSFSVAPQPPLKGKP